MLFDFFALYALFVLTGGTAIACACFYSTIVNRQQLRNHRAISEHMLLAQKFRRLNGQPILDEGFSGNMTVVDRQQLSYHEEEFGEFSDAILEGEPDSCRLKELADNVFTAYQFAAWRGWDLDEALRRVGSSNLSKLGPDGRPLPKGPDGKVPKGPNYKPPYLEDLV